MKRRREISCRERRNSTWNWRLHGRNSRVTCTCTQRGKGHGARVSLRSMG